MSYVELGQKTFLTERAVSAKDLGCEYAWERSVAETKLVMSKGHPKQLEHCRILTSCTENCPFTTQVQTRRHKGALNFQN